MNQNIKSCSLQSKCVTNVSCSGAVMVGCCEVALLDGCIHAQYLTCFKECLASLPGVIWQPVHTTLSSRAFAFLTVVYSYEDQ